MDVRTECVIARAPEDVAAFAADPDHVPQWYANIRSVEWKTSRPVRVGAQIAFVAHFLGRRLAYTYEVVEWDPPHRFVMRTAEGPFPMETTYTWESTPDGGTRMTLRNRGTPTGFSKWLAPFMAIAVRRANRQDLKQLKTLLEGHGREPGPAATTVSAGRRVLMALALALGSVPASALAQPVRDDQRAVFARMLGDWRGSGTVTGRASSLTMTWTVDLGGAFVHLRFLNMMDATATRPAEVFEARGYYRVTGNGDRGVGTWVDSRGLILPLAVTIAPDSMTVEWGDDATERGQTIYHLVAGDTLEVIDSVRDKSGQLREFGRSTLRRAR